MSSDEAFSFSSNFFLSRAISVFSFDTSLVALIFLIVFSSLSCLDFNTLKSDESVSLNFLDFSNLDLRSFTYKASLISILAVTLAVQSRSPFLLGCSLNLIPFFKSSIRLPLLFCLPKNVNWFLDFS